MGRLAAEKTDKPSVEKGSLVQPLPPAPGSAPALAQLQKFCTEPGLKSPFGPFADRGSKPAESVGEPGRGGEQIGDPVGDTGFAPAAEGDHGGGRCQKEGGWGKRPLFGPAPEGTEKAADPGGLAVADQSASQGQGGIIGTFSHGQWRIWIGGPNGVGPPWQGNRSGPGSTGSGPREDPAPCRRESAQPSAHLGCGQTRGWPPGATGCGHPGGGPWRPFERPNWASWGR